MMRWIHLYPLTGLVLNLLLGMGLGWFGEVCLSNYAAMGFALPGLTLWALRWTYAFYLLAAMAAGGVCLSGMQRLPDRHLYAVAFGILVADAALLLLAALGYVLPYLHFPVQLSEAGI